uniref:Uncharacterized protein n=1 Tax=Glossina brevipalpis TaxID=37001 RepID=A0A1A9WPF8_9MUSC
MKCYSGKIPYTHMKVELQEEWVELISLLIKPKRGTVELVFNRRRIFRFNDILTANQLGRHMQGYSQLKYLVKQILCYVLKYVTIITFSVTFRSLPFYKTQKSIKQIFATQEQNCLNLIISSL